MCRLLITGHPHPPQQALFPGDSELQQLLHIFKALGTPNEDVWPGVTKFRDWHEFPNWKAQPLESIVPNLEPAGIDLLAAMFVYDPAKRITVRSECVLRARGLNTPPTQAKEALLHPYFDDLDKEAIDALESETVRNSED